MQSDGAVAVTERLQEPDVGALGGDEPRQDDVEQEHRDRQEDRRQDRRHRAQLRQFVREIARRQHAIAAISTATTMGREQPVDVGGDGARRCARREPQHDIVEGAVEVERSSERLAAHPDDAEAARLGQDVAGRHREHELGTAGDARDAQRPTLAAQQHGERRARPQAVRLRERLVEQHFGLLLGVRPTPLAQHEVVHHRPAPGRERHHAGAHRLHHARQVDEPDAGDTRLGRTHALDRRELRRDALGRTHQ